MTSYLVIQKIFFFFLECLLRSLDFINRYFYERIVYRVGSHVRLFFFFFFFFFLLWVVFISATGGRDGWDETYRLPSGKNKMIIIIKTK